MVSGAGSGGVDRIGGRGIDHALGLARDRDRARDPHVRQELMRLYSEERIRDWTNQRVRAQVKAGRSPGPESSIGKVHQGGLNQRVQLLAVDLLGMDAIAWDGSGAAGYSESLPAEVRGMLRSRANTIEGGTTEVNKNVVGERVLGLPREPDPYRRRPGARPPGIDGERDGVRNTARRARRSGGLADLQSTPSRQRDGRAHDAGARSGVARARSRSRRARDREHRRGQGVPDRARRRAAESRPRSAARAEPRAPSDSNCASPRGTTT